MDLLIANVTSSLLSEALDICSANHKIISNNIANVSSENFVASKLDFDQMMSAARSAVASGDDAQLSEALDALDANSLPVITSEEPVSLDGEMVELTSNTLRYQALVDIRSGLGGLLKTAISGGK